MKKRILSIVLCLCMALTLLPTAALAADVPAFSGGSGVQDDPWQISSKDDLVTLATFVNDGSAADFDATNSSIGNFSGYYFEQTANIDMTDAAWEPIGYCGSYYFAGNYDGGNYTVSNLTSTGKLDTEGYATAGLFGWAAFGSVSNVKIDNAYLLATGSNNYSYVGGIAAVAYGSTIENCTVTDSSITSARTPNNSNCAGGIAGYSTGGTFKNCTSKNNAITTMCYGGGFVGEMDDDSGVGTSSFSACTAEDCTVTSNSDNVQITTQIGGFAGEVTNCTLSITNCDVLSCRTVNGNSPQTIGCQMGIFAGNLWGDDSTINDTDCRYATDEENPQNIGSSAVQVVKIGDQYVAIANVSNADEMAAALNNSAIDYINITGSFSYDGAISKAVAINVKNGSTLTLNYMTDNSKVSTVCNADITVEDGGVVCFNQQYTMNTSYLVMNGDFVLNSGATVTTTSAAFAGNILFQGAFTNNGSFDTKNGNAFLKYGTTSGTFTNSTPCYNLCIKTPTKTSVSDAKLYITGVVGTVAVGEKLHPVLDGLGEITKTIPGLGISWGDMSSGGATFEYTVPASKAGSAITVKVNGSPSNSSYAYFLVNGTTVTKVTTPDSTGYTTAKVVKLDTVYVGGASASDSNTGASADKALASITTALSAVADNGKIVLCGDVETTANGWLTAKGSVTITNTDGTNTYSNAVLTLNGAQFASGNITFEDIQFAVGTTENSGILVPSANVTSLCFSNVTATGSDGKLLPLSVQNAYRSTGVTVTVKDCNIQLDTSNVDSLTLNHATVISKMDTADPLGNVSLTNGSTLLTPQIINNLTSDNSENALALFSNEGTPVSVTVNGIVTIAEGKPITLLNYTDNTYQAFTAGNLTLLTSIAANDSLTADKFITKDTINYSLKKADNNIVTEKKIVVTFHANGGTCETATMIAGTDGKLASLPTPTRSGSYTFDGWYTLENGGTKITTDHIFADSTTVYAHWSYTGGSSSGSSTTPSITVPVSSDEGKVSVSASVSSTTATITVTDKQLAEFASNTAITGTVTVDLSGLKNVDSAKIPAKVITAANTATGSEGLEIILPTGTVKLDKTALSSVASSNKDITVSVETVKTSTLTTAQKQALGDKIDSAVVVDINVLVNGVKVTNFNGGTLTVSFPYTPKSGEDTSKLTVWYMKDDGTIEKMGGHYDSKNKCFVFETTHLSKYVLVSDSSANPFTDVSANAYYYDAVLCAVEKGVTSGTSATTFAPNVTCTRAQTVTFLWRATGSPEPTTTVNPFTDISADAYYYKAVLWAAEKGITAGTSATAFSPDAIVSRAQVATFLWRAAGKPAATKADSFTDVSADAYYSDAVLWAAEKGITSGTSATTFSPIDGCSRAQIVTFLYRYMTK